MTYGYKRNNGYEGEHVTPSGMRAFKVYYIDRDTVRAVHTAQRAAGRRVPPPGHHNRFKAGWYWITVADQAAGRDQGRVGPFTSSRNAYQAAIERLETGRG